jgi:hypothetical protein
MLCVCARLRKKAAASWINSGAVAFRKKRTRYGGFFYGLFEAVSRTLLHAAGDFMSQ